MASEDEPASARSALDARNAQGLQVGDNNVQNNTLHQYGPVVRPAYLEHVRRIARPS
jgi:hypothetical protein